MSVPTAERLELAAEVKELRETGMTFAAIADRLLISHSYAHELFSDPDGARKAALKASYRGTCESCGGATDGSNGPNNTPRLCKACYDKLRPRAQHGSITKYTAGCSCDACRAANTAYGRSLKGRTPPTHSVSGYQNYGCRCKVCTRAHRDAIWLLADERKRYPSLQRRAKNPDRPTTGGPAASQSVVSQSSYRPPEHPLDGISSGGQEGT